MPGMDVAYEFPLASMSQRRQEEESYLFAGDYGGQVWDINDNNYGYYGSQAPYAEIMTNQFLNDQAQIAMGITTGDPAMSTQMGCQAQFCDPNEIHNGAVPAL